jgi:putative ABC transport system ATP-binding protein
MTLTARGLCVAYADAAGRRFEALSAVDVELRPGRMMAIAGPSGSGKSTLIQVLAGLRRPDAGALRHGNVDILSLSERRRDRWRRDNVGLVFQDFHLIAEMTPEDNVLVAAWFNHFSAASLRPRARRLLADLGVPASRARIAALSRGERQRVAIARALIFDPPLVLADEPTASLDGEGAAAVATLLADLARGQGRAVAVVSHDERVIALADDVLRLERGRALTSVDA